MKTLHHRFIALVLGIALFDFLFYKQSPGINALLFVPVILGMIRLAGRNPLGNQRLIFTATGLLSSGIAVALYGSATSVLAYMGAFLVFLGFSLEPELRSSLAALFQGGTNFFTAPLSMADDISESLKLRKYMPGLLKILKLLVIPLIILFIFTTIYRFANPLFNRIFLSLDVYFLNFIVWLEQYLAIGRLVFLFFTALLIMGVLYSGKQIIGKRMELNRQDELFRRRRKNSYDGLFPRRFTGLRDECKMGIMLLAMLNLLLLLVNFTEVAWASGEFHKASAHDMSQHLHEGTGLLIFSIGLSMVVMLYLFRKNLNFYSGNKWLITGALVWILQNAIMAANVATRNWFYISHYGLTYKRIGVYFFLLLVVSGLALLWIKIRQRKTIWYLLRTNAWSFYFSFILLALINWDPVIASYNIANRSTAGIDVETLMNLPDRTLQILDENRGVIFAPEVEAQYYSNETLDLRIQSFVARQEKFDWQSYTLQDRKVYNYFKKLGPH